MKLNITKFVLGVACAAIAASTASAQTTLYLYGSTAYRKATYVAIGQLFSNNAANVFYDKTTSFGGTPNWSSTTDKTSASAALGATNIVWTGTIGAGSLNGQSVQIYCNWAGSVGGIKSIATTSLSAVGSFGVLNGGGTAITGNASHIVDIAMSDAFQDESSAASFVPGFIKLDDKIVSVLEFFWCKGHDSVAGIQNLNTWTIRSLMGGGVVDQSQITGLTGDIGKKVFLTGRDDDSGTRLIAQLDSTYNPSLEVFQYQNVDASDLTFFGDGSDGLGLGFNVGADVVGALNQAFTYPVTVTDQFFGTSTVAGSLGLVGYVAVADAVKGFASGSTTPAGSRTLADFDYTGKVPQAQILTYNGVTYSEAAINNGYYTYWAQEHSLTRSSATTTVKNFKTDLNNEQISQAGALVPGTEKVGLLNISRSADGLDISWNEKFLLTLNIGAKL